MTINCSGVLVSTIQRATDWIAGGAGVGPAAVVLAVAVFVPVTFCGATALVAGTGTLTGGNHFGLLTAMFNRTQRTTHPMRIRMVLRSMKSVRRCAGDGGAMRFRHRIIAGAAPRMAATDPPRGEPAAGQRAVRLDGVDR